MFESVNEIAVIVSAILAVAIGSIWYSPLMFGNQWMKAIGLSEEDFDGPGNKNNLTKMIIVGAVSNFVALYMIAQFISISEEFAISIFKIATLLAIFVGAIMANQVNWEKKSTSYFLINFGYSIVVIFMGIAVIGYWPW